MRKTITALGPVYIKIFQVLSTRADIFTPTYLSELAKLRDHVPAESDATLQRALRAAYPDGADKLFTSFSSKPIGAGCICQVHAAVLHSGEKVAVKIRRPGVHRKIAASFDLLRTVIRFGSLFSKKLKTVDVTGIVSELEKLLLSQTDLDNERNNMERFRIAFADYPDIRVPRTFADCSSASILVMEFVEGVAPYQYEQLDIDPLKLAETIDNLQDAMIFFRGLCHADLHPGNFYWTRDGKLILIDFGLVYDISLDQRNHLLTFYVSVLDGYYDFATRYFLKHFLVERDSANREHALQHISDIVRKHWVDSEGKPQFANIFQQVLTVLSRCDLSLKTDYSPLFLTLITLEGYLYSLDPAFDMLENYRRKRLSEAEYTAIAPEAEKLILGKAGTYSTALFSGVDSVEAAYEQRNRFIDEQLDVDAGDLVIDVGCGRGWLLDRLKARGVRGLGITMSRLEHQACKEKELNCLWTSWEEADPMMEGMPPADAIAVVEMIFHLASLHENKEGLLDERLQRFFTWSQRHLRARGTLFLQTLNIKKEFLFDPAHRPLFERVCRTLPWMGFSTIEQLVDSAETHFEIEALRDDSGDLLPTYRYWKNNIVTHEHRLRQLIKPTIFDFLCKELDTVIELSEAGLLSLHRITLKKFPNTVDQ